MRNGRIVRAEARLPQRSLPCEGCGIGDLSAYDPVRDRALWASYDVSGRSEGLRGLSVVGPERQLATLSCPDDFACRPGEFLWDRGVTLGPAADELTLESADRVVQVISYDGAVRHTLDLSAPLKRHEGVDALAWSPDGSRLAVVTKGGHGSGGEARIWLFARDGSRPVLVHTSSYPEASLRLRPPCRRARGCDFARLTYVSHPSWSPNGSRLGFVESFYRIGGDCRCEAVVAIRAVALALPDAGEDDPGTARTLYQVVRSRDSMTYVENLMWSPDGARVALRTSDGILELSPDDRTVLARDPRLRWRLAGNPTWLIWPARHR
jgi:hypothetical protein